MKLADIPKGSDLAYDRAVNMMREQIAFELETCTQLYGTDPNKVLALLAIPIIADPPENVEDFSGDPT
jgi:hypothetical protein